MQITYLVRAAASSVLRRRKSHGPNDSVVSLDEDLEKLVRLCAAKALKFHFGSGAAYERSTGCEMPCLRICDT